MTTGKRLIQTSALLAGATLIYKLLGFAEKLAMAHVFGTGAAADAYLAGAGVVLLFGFLLTDIVGPALIPVVLAEDQGGATAGTRSRARRTLGATLGFVLLGAIPLAALGWLGAGVLASLFGPGFAPATHALTAEVIRIGIIALPALCVAAIFTAWYQAHEQFLRPAFADMALKIGPLLGIVAFGGIHGLAWGLLIGALLRTAGMLGGGLPLRPNLDRRDAGLAQVVAAGWPLLMTALVSVHLIGVIETALASTLGTGAVAALAYARRIVDVPVMLAPQVVAKAVFPALSALALERDYARLATLLQRCIRIAILVSLPLTIIGTLLATPIVRLLLERGAFDGDSVAATSLALTTILPGLPALALSTLLVRFSYATGDTRTPSAIRAAGAALQVVLALWWRHWGLAGLGWATTASLWIETIALVWAARRAVNAPRGRDGAFWAKLTAAGALCGASVLAARPLFFQPAGALEHLLFIAPLTIIGCLGYGAALLLGKVAEAEALLRWTRQPKRTRRREANP